MPERRGPGCGGMLLRLLLLALAIPLVIAGLLAAFGLGLFRGDSTDASSDPQVPAATETAWETPTPTTTEVAAPTPTGTDTPTAASPSATESASTPATAYPPVRITGRECAREGTGPYAATAAGNDATTCAFAVAVRQAYLVGGEVGRPTTITAYSQARGEDVRMRCTGGQPARCTSSGGALVYLYGGSAVTS